MPTYMNRTVLEIARGAKAFFTLEAGLTRGELPNPELKLRQIQNRVEKLREQVARKDRRIVGLQQRLSDEGESSSGAVDQRPANGHQSTHKLRGREAEFHDTRRSISFHYLSGKGLEIGALHRPLEVPADAEVSYVDRFNTEQLREHYPELSKYELVEVDIIDDGESLETIPDASVDFVIANHMLEHCQNPIATIRNHLRVLKPSGILYVAVPDKRFTFDRSRPVTSLKHLVRDYNEGPEWSLKDHLKEWALLVEDTPKENVAIRVKRLIETKRNIHFHVWTPLEFIELLIHCRKDQGFSFELELTQQNEPELVSILRKKS